MEHDYRTHSRRMGTRRHRSTAGSGQKRDKTRLRIIKLLICLGLLIVGFFIKLIFPSTAAAIREQLAGSVDYRAAFTAIGEGISGEKKFAEALGEAYAYAFRNAAPSETETNDPSDGEEENEPAETEEPEATEDPEPSPMQTDEPSEGPGSEGSAEGETVSEDQADFSQAVINAFLESQLEYSDLEIPAGVTYDLPPISFDYICPVMGTVSSTFGYRIHPIEGVVKFHYGTDIAADTGEEILAFADGTVLSVGESTSLGNYLILEHAEGVKTEYAHCSEVYVESGQTITKGEKIAAVGATGSATAAHLHFEIIVDGIYVNPEYYVSWT